MVGLVVVVERLGNFFQWISRYPADKTYWLEYILSGGWQFVHWIKISPLQLNNSGLEVTDYILLMEAFERAVFLVSREPCVRSGETRN